MDWQEKYKEKVVAADEAVKVVKSGDRVVFANFSGHPKQLARALVKQKDGLKDVKIFQASLPPGAEECGAADYFLPEMSQHFKPISFYLGGHDVAIKAVAEGRAEHLPVSFSQIPQLFENGTYPVDVAFIHISTPDEQGYCNYGICIDYTKRAAETARTVVAEVNQQMPRTFGDTLIHVSDIDYLVKCDYDLPVLPEPAIGKIEKEIGRNVAELVEDGATLQLGYGKIPNAICNFLTHKRDLGIHTEMIPSGVVRLAEKGVITGRKKTLHPGKLIATFHIGTAKLYRWLDNNPLIEMHTVDYTNSPDIIAKNYKMTSINSFLQVDFYGNVNSEMIGELQYSGIGGQLDFVRGASAAPGGKSVLANTSTANGGKISRIVPNINPSSVSVPRTEVQYVVTEYGTANLKGKTINERCKMLIDIAHPDFRDWLLQEAKRINLF